MSHISYSLHDFRRDLSVWCLSALLAGCSEQRYGGDPGTALQFTFSPEKASVADSIFDSPSSISR